MRIGRDPRARRGPVLRKALCTRRPASICHSTESDHPNRTEITHSTQPYRWWPTGLPTVREKDALRATESKNRCESGRSGVTPLSQGAGPGRPSPHPARVCGLTAAEAWKWGRGRRLPRMRARRPHSPGTPEDPTGFPSPEAGPRCNTRAGRPGHAAQDRRGARPSRLPSWGRRTDTAARSRARIPALATHYRPVCSPSRGTGGNERLKGTHPGAF